jgi:hypothetical protein
MQRGTPDRGIPGAVLDIGRLRASIVNNSFE